MVFTGRKTFLFVALLTIGSTILVAQPTARTGAQMAFDSDRGTIILFGGVTPSDSSGVRTPLGDTWEWNGRRWIRLFPSTSPSPRSDFVLLSDTNRSRLILFGGSNAATESFNDTWVFDDGQWMQLNTPASPPARRFTAAAFDPVRDRIVMFGGVTQTATTLFDTWEFDGTTWNLIKPDGPKVSSPMLVYDHARAETLMLGLGEDGKPLMHRWNGTDWEKLTPTDLPPCAAQGALVDLEHAARIFYYGGICSSVFPSAESWVWDGTNWTKIEPSLTAGAVFSAAAAYDPIRRELVLFGGNSGGARNSTFRFRDNQWLFVDNDFEPGPRSLMVFESDPARNVIWLFGGQNESQRFADLWSYSFGRWQRVTATGGPAGCDFPNGAFDKQRNRLVLLCENSDIFEWDGEKWYTFTDLKEKPPARRWSSMVYDERNQKVVVFGGYDGNYLRETWTWDGREWKEIEKNRPPSRALGALFYDPTQQRVMLFGGIGRPNPDDAVRRYGDMWSFDGTSWTETKNVTLPAARYGTYIETNPLSSRVVMFGGKDEREKYLNEHWEWDGSTWRQIDSANRPSPRMNGGMTFDPTRQTLVLFGGYAGAYFSEVWALNGGRWDIVPDQIQRRRRPSVTTPPADSQSTPDLLTTNY